MDFLQSGLIVFVVAHQHSLSMIVQLKGIERHHNSTLVETSWNERYEQENCWKIIYCYPKRIVLLCRIKRCPGSINDDRPKIHFTVVITCRECELLRL
jgi:hypothetical protein